MTKSITLNYTIAAIAVVAMVLAYAGIADAAVNSTSIKITTTNVGSINSITTADSHTGQNFAAGSTGGGGGGGGAVLGGNGSENNGGASAGNGGNGGNGGAGGYIETGNATSNAGSENSLNGTDVDVAFDCDCGDINSVTLAIDTNNNNTGNVIKSDTQARARSGQNLALGSKGGTGGGGGAIDGSNGSENNGGASAGTGGSGGAGGLGGEIHTGNASSTSGSLNLLNTTIIRVRL